eukprot:CAMPEP_0170453096 /NCGR_PEP_ID=MMETSP0123-20130129/1786_1 /TAXON_ID=182087 /ORGANISM="Favella ehrenbergii, Strain Fehren 1" /LENGTH=93 /DNA_ID=CAMNT_0010715343 /DNA_START=368 /DNA_END=646 /DNA_ORIENTATION=+
MISNLVHVARLVWRCGEPCFDASIVFSEKLEQLLVAVFSLHLRLFLDFDAWNHSRAENFLVGGLLVTLGEGVDEFEVGFDLAEVTHGEERPGV